MLKTLFKEFTVHVSNLSERLRRMQLDDIYKGVLDCELRVDTNPVALRSPFVSGKTIHFPEVFLNFHWCICFYLCAVTEKVFELKKGSSFDGRVPITGLVLQAHQAKEWALGLRFDYAPWPDDSFDPYADTKIHNYVRLVFKYSLSFILFHEYGHSKLRHSPTSDRNLRIAQEREADQFALETIYHEILDGEARDFYIVGVACAGLSMLYTVTDPQDIAQTKHPDIDVRILNHLSFFQLANSNTAQYVHELLTIGFQGFMYVYGLKFSRASKGRPSWEYLEYLSEIIARAKHGT